MISRVFISLAAKFFPTWAKRHEELAYWKGRKQAEGVLSNDHYKYFYTEHFGINEDFYQGKALLDIGCGPRGSLEWASMAARRVGLDPLAGEYLKLGADRHRMEYVAAPSEAIPLPDASIDVVFSFNALDHVDDVEITVQEIKRVTRPGGLFLLLVEVNHPPSYCEPHQLTPQSVVASLGPEFECEGLDVFSSVESGIYQSIAAGRKIPRPEQTKQIGYLSAKFVRT